MYSGGDSSGDGVNSRNQFNWQITSQTSCNMNSGGSIDWASLAQQWIQMKDSGAGLPEAPPPPILGTNLKPNKNMKFDEQGEADMEVEREDEMQISGFAQNTPPPLMNSINPNVWFNLQHDAASYVAPQQNQWTAWPPRVALPPPVLHVPITESLTPPIGKEIIKSTPLQNNVKTTIEVPTFLPNKDSLEPPPMDAAKRKILPAWIREGLEKMEREKLKQIEREQKDKHETVVGAGISAADNDINSKIKTMVKSSIMDMEGESSGNEANETAAADDDNDIDGDAVLTSSTHVPLLEKIQQEIFNSGKTYEERISDMMIAVRKTLTELLLEVTNEEISSIAHEEIRKRRAKASSAQVIRKSAIPSITGKLGLEAYADSDSENNASDTEATNDDSKRSDDDYDSEEELKANIRICKRAFAKTIEDIEERIQASVTREEALRREHQKRDRQERETSDSHKNSSSGKTKGFDPEIGEPQPDKKSNSNGKRKKERTSRFTDNKDSKHRMSSTYYQPPSMGSGNLPSPTLLGTLMPPANFLPSKNSNSSNSTVNSISMVTPLLNEKRSSYNNGSTSKSSKLRQTSPPPPPPPPAITSSSSSSTVKSHRHSESSSSSSSDSTSSDTHSSQSPRSKASSSHKKRSSIDRSKRSYRSSSYRSSRRRDSSDSHDDDHYKRRSSRRHTHKSNQSSSHSRRHDNRRSDTGSSRSRTRSRSRSRSTYSSSRRGDRY